MCLHRGQHVSRKRTPLRTQGDDLEVASLHCLAGALTGKLLLRSTDAGRFGCIAEDKCEVWHWLTGSIEHKHRGQSLLVLPTHLAVCV